MNKIAMFEKVSLNQFKEDFKKATKGKHSDEYIEKIYDSIQLPKRATTGSAGHDFKMPFLLRLEKGKDYTIPTGIRCKMSEGWVLMIYPRSGLGFKYGMALKNTTGIIDEDYYDSDNEGHIMIKVSYDTGDNGLFLEGQQSFAQGVFLPYGITEDDNVETIRNGGFGSTGK